MAKIKQKLSKALKKLSIKKLHIKVSNFLSKKNLQSLHGPEIFCGFQSTHGLAATRASLLANDAKCVDSFHFRSGNFAYE